MSKSSEPAGLLNLLVAYPYMTNGVMRIIDENRFKIRFVLDSGAFTAWKAGKTISLDEYCKFIEGLKFQPWRYFTLDVIGDPEATRRNYDVMYKRGFRPVPVFTRGENLAELDHYYESSDVVAIGGLVGTRGNKGFVKGIMGKVGKRKAHLLGFTNLTYLKYFKPYMADSSTWEMGARYGSCPLYMGNGKPLTTIRKGIVHRQLKDEAICDAISKLGFDPHALLVWDNWNGGYSTSRRLGAVSHVALSMDVQEKLGTLLFLAATTDYAISLLLEGLDARSQPSEWRNGFSNRTRVVK